MCLNLGANINLAKRSLRNFSGVQRRMTKVFSKNKNDFYDDYAHHPTEIKFAELIAKNSKTQVIIVKNQVELSNFLKRHLTSNEIIIGMGAGAISRWMSELKNTL